MYLNKSVVFESKCRLNSSLDKSLIERVSNEVFQGYNVDFDDCYPCTKNNIKCNPSQLYNVIKLFIFLYNLFKIGG